MHIGRTLSVPLGELDLDLTPTNPFMVQVVKSVLCIPDIFKCSCIVKGFYFEMWRVGTEKAAHMHNNLQ